MQKDTMEDILELNQEKYPGKNKCEQIHNFSLLVDSSVCSRLS
jgi:hypothetical protein